MWFNPKMFIAGIATAVSIYAIVYSAAKRAQPASTTSLRSTSSDSGNNSTEERSFNQFVDKTPGLSSKFSVLKNNPEVIAAVSNPAIKKLGTAIEKNPKFLANLAKDPAVLEKLAKNPQVANVVKVLERNHVSFTA